jgi:hypothetical protein
MELEAGGVPSAFDSLENGETREAAVLSPKLVLTKSDSEADDFFTALEDAILDDGQEGDEEDGTTIEPPERR